MRTSRQAPEDLDLGIERIRRVLASHDPSLHTGGKPDRHAAVAMVLRDSPGGGAEALYIKRAEHPLDPWSGHMAFPGGHKDPTDRTLDEAARRETFEEVGLQLTDDMRIGRIDDLHGNRRHDFTITVSHFVYHFPHEVELTLNDEVADTVWVPLSYLADLKNVTPYLFPTDPERRNFPSYQYGPYTIWGMTYRMTGNFLRLFGVETPGDGPLTEVE